MGNLTRENEKEEWGFILTGGGRDKDVRLFIEQVKPGSIAEKVGLKVKDSLVKIGNDCALDYTRDEAMESLKRGKDFFDMIVERNGGCPQVIDMDRANLCNGNMNNKNCKNKFLREFKDTLKLTDLDRLNLLNGNTNSNNCTNI